MCIVQSFGMNPEPVTMIFYVTSVTAGGNGDLLKQAGCVTTGYNKEEKQGDKQFYLGRYGDSTVILWNIFI